MVELKLDIIGKDRCHKHTGRIVLLPQTMWVIDNCFRSFHAPCTRTVAPGDSDKTKIRFDPNDLKGRYGLAEIGHRTYVRSDGESGKTYEIQNWIESEEPVSERPGDPSTAWKDEVQTADDIPF